MEHEGAALLVELIQDEAIVSRKFNELKERARLMGEMFQTPHCSGCGADLRIIERHECPIRLYNPKYAKAKLANELIKEAIKIAPSFSGTPKERADQALETIDAVIDDVLSRIRKTNFGYGG